MSTIDLRAQLRRRGLTQSELARKLAINEKTVSYALDGKSHLPDRVIEQVAVILGLRTIQVAASLQEGQFRQSLASRVRGSEAIQESVDCYSKYFDGLLSFLRNEEGSIDLSLSATMLPLECDEAAAESLAEFLSERALSDKPTTVRIVVMAPHDAASIMLRVVDKKDRHNSDLQDSGDGDVVSQQWDKCLSVARHIQVSYKKLEELFKSVLEAQMVSDRSVARVTFEVRASVAWNSFPVLIERHRRILLKGEYAKHQGFWSAPAAFHKGASVLEEFCGTDFEVGWDAAIPVFGLNLSESEQRRASAILRDSQQIEVLTFALMSAYKAQVFAFRNANRADGAETSAFAYARQL
jgi:hypothetical protein